MDLNKKVSFKQLLTEDCGCGTETKMKEGGKTKEQPGHRQGEWVIKENSQLDWIETTDPQESKIICTMSSNDKSKANARRIVRAVNIISKIEKEIEGSDWINSTSPYIINQLRQLLKQAEQK